MAQPEKVARPETADWGFAAQVMAAPLAGGVMLRATDAVLDVIVLPPASWTATDGWVPKAIPAVEPDGSVAKRSLLAEPTAIVKLALSAWVRVPELAVSVYVPDLSTLQPAKVATPATADVGFSVQVRVAPAGVVMLRVIGALLTPTGLPPASWTVTTGWVARAMPPVEPEGCVVKASLVAGPEVFQLFPLDRVLAVNAAAARPRGAIARATAVSTTTSTTPAEPASIRSRLNTEARLRTGSRIRGKAFTGRKARMGRETRLRRADMGSRSGRAA